MISLLSSPSSKRKRCQVLVKSQACSSITHPSTSNLIIYVVFSQIDISLTPFARRFVVSIRLNHCEMLVLLT